MPRPRRPWQEIAYGRSYCLVYIIEMVCVIKTTFLVVSDVDDVMLPLLHNKGKAGLSIDKRQR